MPGNPLNNETLRERSSCWPLPQRRLTIKPLLVTQNHLPQSSQHVCLSIIRLTNSSCSAPLLRLTLSHFITLLAATPSVRCPSLFESATYWFQSESLSNVSQRWEATDKLLGEVKIKTLASTWQQLYSSWRWLLAAFQVPWRKHSDNHSAAVRKQFHRGRCQKDERGENSRFAGVRKHWISC